MKQVSGAGRTILFVSHNTAAVKALCTKAILLEDGKITASGSPDDALNVYFGGAEERSNKIEWNDPQNRPGNENVRLRYVRVIPPHGKAVINIDTGADVEIGFENYLEKINFDCNIVVVNSEGIVMFESGHIISSDNDSRRGFHQLRAVIPPHLLNAGRYSLHVLFGKDQRYVLFRLDDVVSFEIENTSTGRGLNMSVTAGVIRPLLEWQHEFCDTAFATTLNE